MDFNTIIFSIVSIGGLGIIFGIILGFAAKKFEVEQDPNIPLVRQALPGANCGGCGFAGCDAYAEAVVSGKAKPNGCPVGGSAVAAKISEILGIDAGSSEKLVAFVKCKGSCDKSIDKYEYYGAPDCSYATYMAGGAKGCQYGCLGLGSCVKACQFDAIKVVNGVAVVDKEKCVACGKCVSACPKGLIELIPYESKVQVGCNSKDNGKTVKSNCQIGCIGCKICEKNCPFDAVHVENFLSKVDYSKCKNCGICTQKCPTKAISKQGVAAKEEKKDEQTA